MAQLDVYDFIKSQPGIWFTSKDIADTLNIRSGTITVNINKMATWPGVSIKRNTHGRTFQVMYREEEVENNDIR